MLKILAFTSLFPNSAQPTHGIFVENRLRELAASGKVQLTVVAPVPFFPRSGNLGGRYAAFARAPLHEKRHGLDIFHPRYPVLPKIGMAIAPALMAAGVARCVRRLCAERRFDLIDAHYFYPDGVAAALLARRLELPLVVTARGSDISEIAQYALPRRQILWAARRADALVAVCEALKQAMVGLGMKPDTIHVFRNGVDLAMFRYVPSTSALGAGLRLLSVGHLVPRKGHDLAIRALAQLPNARLTIVGSGPEEARLKGLAQSLGLADRVELAGHVPHEALAGVYSAADILVLGSSREGWANVLLEALACGTPVVATDVWGTGEVVREPVAGELVAARTPDAVAEAIRRLAQRAPPRDAVRAYAARFSWNETTANQLSLFTAVTAGHR